MGREEEKIVEKYKNRFDQLKQARSTFDSHWDDISSVVRPASASFTSNHNSQGQKKNQDLYDSVGAHSNELLGSGFYSLLTNPSTQWFELKTDNPELNDAREVQMWLKEVSRIMYFEIQRPQTGFATSLHELYMDHGCYGNGILFVTEQANMSSLLFSSLPLQESYFIENDEGRVHSLFRYYKRSVYQMVKKFGIDNVHAAVRDLYLREKWEEKFNCLHVIEPNEDAGRTDKSQDKAFASTYFDLDHTHILKRSGFDECPFMAARFYKMSYETYGRGPGSTALPDLKMLQQIVKTTLRGAQKIVDPPLMVPDQAFVTPLRTLPGSISYYRTGISDSDKVIPLATQGRPELGEDLAQGIRNRVREMFYVDQLQLNEGPQMTATEVLQRTEEKMRLLGPVVGRAQTELLGPCLERVFGLLMRAGRLPDPPEEMMATKLKIIYTSPIAKAQDQTEANGLLRVAQLIAPFSSVDPSVMDVFNAEEIARGLGEMYSLNPKFYRSEQQLAELRGQRAQQQQQASMMEMAKNGGAGLASMASGMKTLGEMQ